MTVQNICKRKSFSNRIGSLLHITRENKYSSIPQTVHRISSDIVVLHAKGKDFTARIQRAVYIVFFELLMDFILFFVLWI